MSGQALLPAIVATIAVAGYIALMRAPLFLRAAFSAGMMAACGAIISVHRISPIEPSRVPLDAVGFWLRTCVVILWFFIARSGVYLLSLILGQRRSREARLLSDLLAAAIHLSVLLIILNLVLGFPVTGLLATSGVIALVVGMALQNTLADVFSGIAVSVEQPFHVGDRIALKDYVEGTVVEINWRSIRIRTDEEDLATVPNTVVAKTQILNRNYPSDRRLARVEVQCPAGSDPERIVDLLMQAAMVTQGVLESPSPNATLLRAGLRTSTYLVEFHAAGLNGLTALKSRLQINARRQLRQAGVLRARHDAGEASPPRLTAVEILGEVGLFASLEPDHLERLAARLRMVALEPGETLFEQGDGNAVLHVILSGVLEVVRRDHEGTEHRVGRLGAGEYVGEISLLTGNPRAASARAITHCELFELDRDALLPLVAAIPEFLPNVERSVARGMELVGRSVSNAASGSIGKGDLLGRLRSIFGAR